MKKIFIFELTLFFVLLFATPHPTHAHGSMMDIHDNEQQTQSENPTQGDSIDTVLANILKSHNVTTVQKLDLSKVSDDEWEQLGDAVMELQHPGSSHEAMDRMMGGEGSESIRQMHINMGKAYLRYGGNYGLGMMGGGMMNFSNDTNEYQRGGGSHMMGNFGFSPMGFYGGGFGLIAMFLFWGLIIFGVVVFLKWILSQGKVSTQGKSALDIIKERYAKGEIDKKEFEEMKKDLQ